jgi:hypothetical protein
LAFNETAKDLRCDDRSSTNGSFAIPPVMNKLLNGLTILVIFTSGYFFVWSLIAGLCGNVQRTWYAFGVPAMQRSFDDSRLMLEGVDCANRGIDPHLEPDCDWRKRPFNYPSVWLSLSKVGLTVNDTNVVGIAIGAVFIFSLLFSFRQTSAMAGLIGGACLVSPAVMLGIERGNTDLLLFFLLVLLSFLVSTFGRWGAVVLAAGVLVTSVLKLYPIAVIVCLFRRQRMTLVVAAITIILFAWWSYYWRTDLVLVRATTPEFAWESFGYKTFFITLFQHFSQPIARKDAAGYLAPTSLPLFFEIVAKLSLIVAITASAALGARTRGHWTIDLRFESERECRFLFGASIFLLTFALGTNFNYRLIFLLLCIPQLVKWAVDRGSSVPFQGFAAALITGIVVICWVSGAEKTVYRGAGELVSWCLFVGFGLVITNLVVPVVATVFPSSFKSAFLEHKSFEPVKHEI